LASAAVAGAETTSIIKEYKKRKKAEQKAEIVEDFESKKEAERVAKMQADLQYLKSSMESTKPTSEQEEMLQRERLKERIQRQDEEIRRRPAVPLPSPGRESKPASYYNDEVCITPASSIRRRPVNAYYEDDRDRARKIREQEALGVRDAQGGEDYTRTLPERRRRSSVSINASGLPPIVIEHPIEGIRRETNLPGDSSKVRRSTSGTRRQPVSVDGRSFRLDPRDEIHDSQTRSMSPPRVEDSEATISDFPSESEDERSTLVEDKGDGDALHLSQQEAQAMMMNFLATFTAVPA